MKKYARRDFDNMTCMTVAKSVEPWNLLSTTCMAQCAFENTCYFAPVMESFPKHEKITVNKKVAVIHGYIVFLMKLRKPILGSKKNLA